MSEETSTPLSDDGRKNLPSNARALIATARNDITVPYYSNVLRYQDDTLIQRGQGKGLKIYDEVERDSHAHAVLQKRKFSLVSRTWTVEQASEDALDIAAADFCRDVLTNRLRFDQLCLDLLDATLKGFSIAEIVWMRDGRFIVPERIVPHDQRRFAFGEDWRPRLLTMEQSLDGIELPERKFIVHRFGVKGNNAYGLGLGSKLFWPVLFKREGIAFWMTFLEKYASPTPVGEYPMGTLETDQNRLLSGLQEMAQANAIVVPAGTQVKFLEAMRTGAATYEEWCYYWDEQMSIAVLGSTLATSVRDKGSRAAADVHKEVEAQIADADGDLLSDTLKNTLLQWLVDYNFPGARVPGVRRDRPKNEMENEGLREKRASNAKAEIDNLFNVMGKLPEKDAAVIASELAGIDLLPDVPLEILQKLAPQIAAQRAMLVQALNGGLTKNPDGSVHPSAAQRVQRAANDFAEHDHGVVHLSHQLAALGDPLIDDMVGVIRQSVRDSASFADLQQRLLADFGTISFDRLGNAIAGALTVAELQGRNDVDSGA